MPQFFTLEEANRAIEVIKPLMEEVQSIRTYVLGHEAELWPAMEKSAGDGGNPALSKLAKDFDRLDALLHRIQAEGAVVKDLNTGLLDFPALRAGQEVCLCWRHGEHSIEYWHEVEAGFAGRQPIAKF